MVVVVVAVVVVSFQGWFGFACVSVCVFVFPQGGGGWMLRLVHSASVSFPAKKVSSSETRNGKMTR